MTQLQILPISKKPRFLAPRRVGLASMVLAIALCAICGSGQIARAQLQFSDELVALSEEAGTLPPELTMSDNLPSPSSSGSSFTESDTILSDMQLHDGEIMIEDDRPSLISSGTWLRRGYWYTQQEVSILTLDLDKNLAVALDEPVAGFGGRVLVFQGTAGGVAANAKLTLGRFLYRDAKNRDHTAEFTFLGLGKWTADGDLRSETRTNSLNTLLSTSLPTTLVFAPGFNNTTHQRFHYESRMNNFEWNYRVRRRLRPDWLVLDEQGEWNREMDPGLLLGFLFGVRWLEITERFDYSAEAVDPTTVNGDLKVRTGNNFVGFQFGGEANYQHKRWSVALTGKAGPYINFNNSRINYSAHDENVAPLGPDFSLQDEGDYDAMAFVGQAGMNATYHARPNLSFRVGWEAMWVNSVALATRQVVFSQFDAVRSVNATSGVQYMGFNVGMDYYW